jgi:hypothetical protein
MDSDAQKPSLRTLFPSFTDSDFSFDCFFAVSMAISCLPSLDFRFGPDSSNHELHDPVVCSCCIIVFFCRTLSPRVLSRRKVLEEEKIHSTLVDGSTCEVSA